jgi:phage N-6-adenine-methyltransferase
MSLVGFQAGAHPQQVAAGTNDAEKDERYTPRPLIRLLHSKWHFTVDAASCAAAPSSQVIGRFWSAEDDGLRQKWDGERIWVNPPYSNVPEWVEKAWVSRAVVVMLLPGNRTEQKWWQRMVEPYRDRRETGLRTHFLPKRINFGTPDHPEGKAWKSSVPFGCVLLIWPEFDRIAGPRQLSLLGGA